ncbi:MAG TPA: hypothetical protein VER36_11725, partial [Flavisolibacter sp.]|nr:hypothetical protein [Flavisolibacter sp.]
MKKFYLLSLLFSFAFVSISAQTYEEIELNNSFASANPLNSNPSILPTGKVGGADSIDYFRMSVASNPRRYTGTITIYIEAENVSSAGSSHRLNLEVFNSLPQNGLLESRYVGGNENVLPGETVYETIELCGQALDSFYLAFTSNGEFEYTVYWWENTIENVEPSNSSATAILLPIRTKITTSVGYTALGDPNHDPLDYFRANAPSTPFDQLFLRIQATNKSCLNGKAIQYELYKNGSVTPFASGYVGSNSAVSAEQEVSSIVHLAGFSPGDHFFVKLTSNAAFDYTVVFWDQEADSDPEPNEELHEAVIMPVNTEKQGRLGLPKFDSDYWVTDELDKYKMVLPHSGTLKLYVKAVNDSCTGFNAASNFIDYYLYNKNESKSQLLGEIFFNSPTVCGDTRFDTITARGLAGDTMVLFLWGDQPLSYTVRFEMMDTARADIEPNGTEGTAIPMNAGEIKSGNIGFFSAPPY